MRIDKTPQILEQLEKLNTFKQEQKDGDIKFRKAWEAEKLKESRKTQVLMFLAIIALSLDLVQLNDAVTILNRLFNLFG